MKNKKFVGTVMVPAMGYAAYVCIYRYPDRDRSCDFFL